MFCFDRNVREISTYLSQEPDIIVLPSAVAFSAQTLSVCPRREKLGSVLFEDVKENTLMAVS
jgi:hypothetical protein